MPRISNIMNKFDEGNFFSSLDLAAVFTIGNWTRIMTLSSMHYPVKNILLEKEAHGHCKSPGALQGLIEIALSWLTYETDSYIFITSLLLVVLCQKAY